MGHLHPLPNPRKRSLQDPRDPDQVTDGTPSQSLRSRQTSRLFLSVGIFRVSQDRKYLAPAKTLPSLMGNLYVLYRAPLANTGGVVHDCFGIAEGGYAVGKHLSSLTVWSMG
jgi:hypothetical protein